MYRKLIKSVAVVLIIASVMGMTTFADTVTDLQKQKNEKQAEIDNTEDELAYVMLQMDELEYAMAEKNDEIEAVNKQLEEAQQKFDAQYEDMKLRIKYMYEDQTTSMSDVLLSSANMSEVLNKAEYVQQVYSYDRSKLDEMSATAKTINDLKTGLEEDMQELTAMDEEFHTKQAALYTSLEELKKEQSDINTKLTAAQQRAARALSSSYYGSYATSARNDSTIASGVLSLAYQLLGTPYASGGSSPAGFDCSGFTSYLFRQYGISLSRTSSGQAYGGSAVSMSDIQPGDVVCYPGHVGIYIGDGQIIHASVPGDVVKIASMNIMTITAIRRYW